MLEFTFSLPLAQLDGPRPGATAPATTNPTPGATPIATPATPAPVVGVPVVSAATGPERAAGALGKPTEFTVAGHSNTELAITWKDADPNVEGFNIYRSDDGGATYAAKPVATKGKSETSFTDSNLPMPNHTYQYKIVAYNSTNTSDPLPGTAATDPAPFLGGYGQYLIIGIMVVGVYFFMMRGQRKDKKKREDMMKELKKGDKVMTIGGMVARVVSVDGDDVVLKIDESANVKATYRKSAIQEVLDRDEKK